MVIKVLLDRLYIRIFLITPILHRDILELALNVHKLKEKCWMAHLKRQSIVIKSVMDDMRQSAYLVVNPITVYSYGFF